MAEIAPDARPGGDEESPQDMSYGEAWAYQILQAVLDSPAWSRTLLIYTYDEHGGYYDHVPPPAAIPPDSIPPDLRPGDVPGGYDLYGPARARHRRLAVLQAERGHQCGPRPHLGAGDDRGEVEPAGADLPRRERDHGDGLSRREPGRVPRSARHAGGPIANRAVGTSGDVGVMGMRRRNLIAALTAAAAVCATLLLVSAPGGTPTVAAATAASTTKAATASTFQLPPVRHVFVIMLENENLASTFGDPSADPYLASTLPSEGAFLDDYYATGHESNDNCISIVSGQPPNPENQADCQFFDDFSGADLESNGVESGVGCVYPSAVQNIGTQLSAAG